MAYLTNADLLEDIANFIEHANNDMANNVSVRILLSKHYDASDLLLVHLNDNSSQVTLFSYEGKNKLHQLSLPTSSLKGIIEHQDFYRPIVATAFPELNAFLGDNTSTNNTSISFTPLKSEGELIGFLVISHRSLSDLLSSDQRQGLKIIANHFKSFLQDNEYEKNQKISNHSANHLISRIRTLLQRTPIMINAFDVHRHCILWNTECERVFGWTHRELQELPDPMSLFYPDTEQREAIERVFAFNDGSEFLEWRPQTRWGDQLVTLWANITLPDGSVLCIGHDITEQRKSESQSRLAASVFESSYEGIMISDSHNRISNVNPAFTRITGYEKDEVIGLDPSLLSSGRHDSTFFMHYGKVLKKQAAGKEKSGIAEKMVTSTPSCYLFQ